MPRASLAETERPDAETPTSTRRSTAAADGSRGSDDIADSRDAACARLRVTSISAGWDRVPLMVGAAAAMRAGIVRSKVH
jgi:hypothetical protein